VAVRPTTIVDRRALADCPPSQRPETHCMTRAVGASPSTPPPSKSSRKRKTKVDRNLAHQNTRSLERIPHKRGPRPEFNVYRWAMGSSPEGCWNARHKDRCGKRNDCRSSEATRPSSERRKRKQARWLTNLFAPSPSHQPERYGRCSGWAST